MIRIRFCTDQDRSRGHYLLMTKSVLRRLRGHIFEIADSDRKLLDEQKLHYLVMPIPEPNGSDEAFRNPPAVDL